MSASLTPNEDATRAALATRSLDGEAARGQAGVSVRVIHAMSEARAIAMAREFDRATPAEQIVHAFVTAMATEIADVAASFSDNPSELGALLVRQISYQAGLIAGQIDSGRFAGVSIPTAEVSRA